MIGTAIGYVRAENARICEAQEREKAVKLADNNGKLANAERLAKEQATRLAKDNEKTSN